MAYEAIVVGAGIEGSATAYQLVKKGVKNVLLLEQFDACHTRGSSHGQSRITRRAYVKPYYVPMMNDAYTLWSDLERESGVTLYKRTGILVFGSSAGSDVANTVNSLSSNKIAHEVFSGREANLKYPHQLKIPDTYRCVHEDGGGILYAQKAVMTFQQQFKKLGGTLLDGHKVSEIVPGTVVTVVTNRGIFTTRNVVIAAGTWAPALCSTIGVQLPFQVVRSEVNYWKVDNPAVFSPDNFPVFIGYGEGGPHFYGLPIEEYPGLLKVAAHFGTPVDPDNRDAIGGPVTISGVAEFISQSLKGVAAQPSITEYCMYTISPDEDPVIDRHPLHKNIIMAAGFSGHGFKLSPIVGQLLAELVMRQTPSHDLHPFRLARFQAPKSSL